MCLCLCLCVRYYGKYDFSNSFCSHLNTQPYTQSSFYVIIRVFGVILDVRIQKSTRTPQCRKSFHCNHYNILEYLVSVYDLLLPLQQLKQAKSIPGSKFQRVTMQINANQQSIQNYQNNGPFRKLVAPYMFDFIYNGCVPVLLCHSIALYITFGNIL